MRVGLQAPAASASGRSCLQASTSAPVACSIRRPQALPRSHPLLLDKLCPLGISFPLSSSCSTSPRCLDTGLSQQSQRRTRLGSAAGSAGETGPAAAQSASAGGSEVAANFLTSSQGDSSGDETEPPPPPAPKSAAQKAKELANRVQFGILLGLGAAVIITYGKQAVLAAAVLVVYQATQEYYGFITSKGISKGMTPPPRIISVVTTVLCISMSFAAYFIQGKSGTALAVAGFGLLVMQVLAIKKPKFSQLASSLFGLFYCGWLPSFWLKLRLITTAAPPVAFTGVLSGFTDWTVGLVATFLTVACIIAADTGAFFVGRSMGRTKLTDISPKKTVEGAAGGLLSSIAVALGGWKVCAWPPTPAGAVLLGVMIFFSSLFGDLIESIMKRDAGLKDSGDLIPGHGGLLDRIDSYIFSGAVAFFYVNYCLPLLASLGL